MTTTGLSLGRRDRRICVVREAAEDREEHDCGDETTVHHLWLAAEAIREAAARI